MNSTNNPDSTSSSEITSPNSIEPALRMKQLVERSHNITIDKNISVSRYFNSGRELIKSAAAFESKEELEKAFILYLRYMTLFLEKLTHHPEYSKADKNEKAMVKKECLSVMELAEKLKARILEGYKREFEQYCATNKTIGSQITEDVMQKRNIDHIQSKPGQSKVCDIDEIDKKFDFSHQPCSTDGNKSFDPFNIEELKQSFSSGN